METLDIKTMEQIRNIVVEAANAKVPLQREKKTRKIIEPKLDVKLDEPKLLPAPSPPVSEVAPSPSPSPEPKKKRVQSEKQKAAFILLQQKGKSKLKNKNWLKRLMLLNYY